MLPDLSATDALLVDALGALNRVHLPTGDAEFITTFQNRYTDIALSPEGRFIGTTFNALFEIDTSTFEETRIDIPVRGSFNALTFSPDGRLFAASTGGEVFRLDVEEETSTKVADVLSSAGDLVYRDGSLFISQFDGDISEIDLGAGTSEVVYETGRNGIFGLTLDKSNEIVGVEGTELISIESGDEAIDILNPSLGDVYGAAPGYLRTGNDNTPPSDGTSLLGSIVSVSTLAQGAPDSEPLITSFDTSEVVQGDEIEFPDVESLFDPSSPVPPGFARSLVDTSIDFGADFIEIDFDNVTANRFASGFENTYIFEFSNIGTDIMFRWMIRYLT
jgi:hypothetical protein